jgi:hypothetical protein
LARYFKLLTLSFLGFCYTSVAVLMRLYPVPVFGYG